jgi:hypothetical protein
MAYKIKVRRSSSSAWTAANPVLSDGEIGFESNTGKFKIGNGTTVWASLNYFKTAADMTFVHTQSSASSTWSITHNLGYFPGGVSVVDSAENVVQGDIIHVSSDALTINFTSAFSGKAYIS